MVLLGRLQKLIRDKRFVLLTLICVVVLVTAITLVTTQRNKNKDPHGISGFSSMPATQQDIDRDSANKQRIVNQQNTQPTAPQGSSGTKQTVKPVITYAGDYGKYIQVAGYVNVFEQGGTCTVTLTQGATTITRSTTAIEGATTANCPAVSIDPSSFPAKGNYTVTLSYSSSLYTGVSDSKQVEIQ